MIFVVCQAIIWGYLKGTLRPVIRQSPQGQGSAEAEANAATVNLARAGDQEALRRLYEQHHRRIYNLIYRMMRKREDAIDLTAETFLRAFQNLKHLKTDEAFGGWLRKVAVNLCLDQIKRRTPLTTSLEKMASAEEGTGRPVEPADTLRGPEEKLIARELGEQVHEALAMLSPDHRAVILLHHMDGKEVKEIAAIMDCSEGTVKSRLARARENLRQLLDKYLKS
ncbi:MAG: sigma-70 family RNA polymerase sigma factor [Armatimonadetes bacterium]|nr:sigma-70 family RNA polymerase sigma factor [Armatimonadota bacterium]NIO75590.1 sigma-70 family RNA polymerase sigma factor [Armatimonadota bacterium]NIO98644.1 sigma-70 family RNA polymerase sigma factor [Armatimonadota bacterium]